MFDSPNPMVTAIMPTTASRLKYLPGALQVFFSQTYPNKELVVVSEDSIGESIPDHPQIRFIKIDGPSTVGKKRNIACDASRGEVIMHVDDDDWSSPTRMAEQLAVLKRHEIPVTGYNSMVFYRESTGEAHEYTNDDRRFCCGTSLMYLRGYQRAHPFLDLNVGEDVNFVYRVPNGSVLAVPAGRNCVARDHDDNTSTREVKPIGDFWKQVDAAGIADLIRPVRRHVVLSLLTWNTRDVSLESLAALKKEAHRFRCLGHEVSIVVVDNGSTDGLQTELKKHRDVKVVLNKTNRGSSVARNQIIDHAKKLKADYLFFNDGDIRIVNGSVVAFFHYLEENPGVGHLGAWSETYTDKPEKMTPYLPSLAGWRITRNRDIFWSQYSLTRMSCFDVAVFPTHGAFGEPAWSAEDNFIGYEFELAGIVNMVVHGLVYGHFHAHGSIRECVKAGIDVQAKAKERIRLFIERFEPYPQFKDKLDVYRNMTIPEDHFRER